MASLSNIRSLCILSVRLLCLLCTLYYGVNVNLISVAALSTLIASFTMINLERKSSIKIEMVKNPFKGKGNMEFDGTYNAELADKVAYEVSNFVCYDPQDTQSLRNFEAIQLNTPCTFAKNAHLWGSADCEPPYDLERTVAESLPTFLKFTMLCEVMKLDGFVFEIPADYGQDVETFRATVLRILKMISRKDPTGKDCMAKNIGRKGWVFEFNKITFFITTFAPCYPSSHPRYAYETDACFILFQPELSFAHHDLVSDTPHTNWDHPKTVRDRIRVAFREAGQEYTIRETVSYPMVWDLVRPLDKTQNYFNWWNT